MKYKWTWKETGMEVDVAERVVAIACMKIAGSLGTEEETVRAVEGQASVRDGGVFENDMYKLEGVT